VRARAHGTAPGYSPIPNPTPSQANPLDGARARAASPLGCSPRRPTRLSVCRFPLTRAAAAHAAASGKPQGLDELAHETRSHGLTGPAARGGRLPAVCGHGERHLQVLPEGGPDAVRGPARRVLTLTLLPGPDPRAAWPGSRQEPGACGLAHAASAAWRCGSVEVARILECHCPACWGYALIGRPGRGAPCTARACAQRRGRRASRAVRERRRPGHAV